MMIFGLNPLLILTAALRRKSNSRIIRHYQCKYDVKQNTCSETNGGDGKDHADDRRIDIKVIGKSAAYSENFFITFYQTLLHENEFEIKIKRMF